MAYYFILFYSLLRPYLTYIDLKYFKHEIQKPYLKYLFGEDISLYNILLFLIPFYNLYLSYRSQEQIEKDALSFKALANNIHQENDKTQLNENSEKMNEILNIQLKKRKKHQKSSLKIVIKVGFGKNNKSNDSDSISNDDEFCDRWFDNKKKEVFPIEFEDGDIVNISDTSESLKEEQCKIDPLKSELEKMREEIIKYKNKEEERPKVCLAKTPLADKNKENVNEQQPNKQKRISLKKEDYKNHRG